jgi:hypothetical protein
MTVGTSISLVPYDAGSPIASSNLAFNTSTSTWECQSDLQADGQIISNYSNTTTMIDIQDSFADGRAFIEFENNVFIGKTGTDTISFRIGGDATGDEVARITNSGFFGIGTTTQSASELLRVGGDALVDQVLTASGGLSTGDSTLLHKTIDIGDWNMDTTSVVSVAHSLDHSKIRSVYIIIYPDNFPSANATPLDYGNSSGNIEGYYEITSTSIACRRVASGFYDSTNFNLTPFNRGEITIWYEP